MQVGEFYETMGTDAVLLVQYAGLNPMGQGDPPRAGCPVANLRRTISDLVEQAGLSVVCFCPSLLQALTSLHGSLPCLLFRVFGQVRTVTRALLRVREYQKWFNTGHSCIS